MSFYGQVYCSVLGYDIVQRQLLNKMLLQHYYQISINPPHVYYMLLWSDRTHNILIWEKGNNAKNNFKIWEIIRCFCKMIFFRMIYGIFCFINYWFSMNLQKKNFWVLPDWSIFTDLLKTCLSAEELKTKTMWKCIIN